MAVMDGEHVGERLLLFLFVHHPERTKRYNQIGAFTVLAGQSINGYTV